MAFTLSGSTITQTGTDTNLSGLSGVDDGYREYSITGTDGTDYLRQGLLNSKVLRISGNLNLEIVN